MGLTLEEIAERAGVSRSTVSRVINDEPYVSNATRERVKEVIEAENFVPNPSARALVTQRTQVIGLFIPTSENIFFTDNSYFPMLLAGIGHTTRKFDYGMLLWLGKGVNENEDFLRKVLHNRQSDGLISASLPSDHPLFNRLVQAKMPLVMIDRPLNYAERLNYVTIDNVRSGEMATEHLIKQGRRRVAHITGLMTISDARDRLQGYWMAIEKAGYPQRAELVVEGAFSRVHGYEAMKRLLPHRPDAVFAAGDTAALGAVQAIHEAGLRVPDDIAVIGFDDLDVAQQSNPKLTTVRQPVQGKGEAAAHLLIDLIEDRVTAPQQVILPTELVIRESCGARPSLTL